MVLKAGNKGHRLKVRAGDSRRERVKRPGQLHSDVQAQDLNSGLRHHVNAAFGVWPKAMRHKPRHSLLSGIEIWLGTWLTNIFHLPGR